MHGKHARSYEPMLSPPHERPAAHEWLCTSLTLRASAHALVQQTLKALYKLPDMETIHQGVMEMDIHRQQPMFALRGYLSEGNAWHTRWSAEPTRVIHRGKRHPRQGGIVNGVLTDEIHTKPLRLLHALHLAQCGGHKAIAIRIVIEVGTAVGFVCAQYGGIGPHTVVTHHLLLLDAVSERLHAIGSL